MRNKSSAASRSDGFFGKNGPSFLDINAGLRGFFTEDAESILMASSNESQWYDAVVVGSCGAELKLIVDINTDILLRSTRI